MRCRYVMLTLCWGLMACGEKNSSVTCGTVQKVTETEKVSDMEFSPKELTLAVGDCVSFVMSDVRNAFVDYLEIEDR